MTDPALIAALERDLAEAEGMASITDLVAAESRRAYERARRSPIRAAALKLAADAVLVHDRVEIEIREIRRRLEDARAAA